MLDAQVCDASPSLSPGGYSSRGPVEGRSGASDRLPVGHGHEALDDPLVGHGREFPRRVDVRFGLGLEQLDVLGLAQGVVAGRRVREDRPRLLRERGPSTRAREPKGKDAGGDGLCFSGAGGDDRGGRYT